MEDLKVRKTKSGSNVTPISEITVKKIIEAGEKSVFINVLTGNTAKITGSTLVWVTHPEKIYETRYRLMGAEADVRATLQRLKDLPVEEFEEANLKPIGDIDSLIDSAITFSNYQTDQYELFELEKENLKLQKLGANRPDLRILRLFGQRIQDGKFQYVDANRKIIGEKRGTKISYTGRSNKGEPKVDRHVSGKEALAAQLSSVKNTGRVLDVSKITETLRGVHEINRPGRSGRGLVKLGLPELDIVSNNYEAYLRAVTGLFGPHWLDEHTAELNDLRLAFSELATAAPVPVIDLPVEQERPVVVPTRQAKMVSKMSRPTEDVEDLKGKKTKGKGGKRSGVGNHSTEVPAAGDIFSVRK